MSELKDVELYAWVGEDELGTGEIGLKQAQMPCGMTPLVAVKREKVDRMGLLVGMTEQAKVYGKKIRLCRFVFAEVLRETESGE